MSLIPYPPESSSVVRLPLTRSRDYSGQYVSRKLPHCFATTSPTYLHSTLGMQLRRPNTLLLPLHGPETGLGSNGRHAARNFGIYARCRRQARPAHPLPVSHLCRQGRVGCRCEYVAHSDARRAYGRETTVSCDGPRVSHWRAGCASNSNVAGHRVVQGRGVPFGTLEARRRPSRKACRRAGQWQLRVSYHFHSTHAL